MGRVGRAGAGDQPAGRNQPRQVHLRHRFDDARAAHAGYPDLGDDLVEALLVRPQIAADDPEARRQGLGIDTHALDRAERGALAKADLRSFERGAGGAEAGEQALSVSENDLGVGADVDHKDHLVGLMRRLRQQDTRGIGADVAGDAR